MIDNLTGLYFTKHNENTFEIKVRENDDKYYLFINGKFIKAYKYKEKLYVEIETIDDDDLDYYCSVEVNDEYSQRKLFRETVNVLRDYRFYKIWNVWEFYREHLLESVDRVFIMEEISNG